MTIYTASKNIYNQLPYAFKTRVYGKEDEIFYNNAPNTVNKTYSELTDYTGFSYISDYARSYNVAIIGNLSISNKIVWDFSTSKYLELYPVKLSEYDVWTIYIKFKSSSNSASGYLFSSKQGYGSSTAGVDISLSSGKLKFQMTTDGSSYQTITDTNTITADTWYWVRASFSINGFFQNNFDFSYSTDGSTWTSLGALTPSGRVVGSSATRLGVYGNNVIDAATTCTFDLTGCNIYMKTSGTGLDWDRIYQCAPIECERLHFSNTVLPWKWQYDNSLKIGSYKKDLIGTSCTFYEAAWPNVTFQSSRPQITQDKWMWLSDQTQYVTKDLPDLGNVWDIYFRFITNSSVQTGGQQLLWIGTGNSENTIWLKAMISNSGTGAYFCTGDGTSLILDNTDVNFQLDTNTIYWIRIGSDGTRTYVYTSTTGYDNMSLLKEVQTPTSMPAKTLYIGYSNYTGKSYLKGRLCMYDLRVLKNGEEIWRGYTPTTLEGCIESLDANNIYHCYVIDGDDHIKLVPSTEAITKDATNPRYLGDVTATV